MGRLWVEGEEVQEAPGLLDVVLRVGPQRMHQLWELEAVPDEEHLQEMAVHLRTRVPTAPCHSGTATCSGADEARPSPHHVMPMGM